MGVTDLEIIGDGWQQRAGRLSGVSGVNRLYSIYLYDLQTILP
jgi:hypothetical protein